MLVADPRSTTLRRRTCRPSVNSGTLRGDERARLHAPGRRRAAAAAARARGRPVRPPQLRRALDGRDRSRGRGLARRCSTTTSRASRTYFGAVLAEGAAELVSVVDADAPPAEQLDAFLGWVEKRGGRLREARARRVARGPRPHGRGARPPPRSGSSTASPARRRPSAASRSARGCGSWTARSSTGSSTATSTARPSARCCCGRSRAPSASRSSPASASRGPR